MRIRTQLIVAAFLLAVVPLSAIVAYSYHSSRSALESAYRREADRLTRQMDRRLAGIRSDLDQRLSLLSALPIPPQATGEGVDDIVTVMGEAAPLVDALEFQIATEALESVTQIRKPAAAQVAEAARSVEERKAPPVERPAEPAPAPAVAAIAPTPPVPATPIVIEIPNTLVPVPYGISEKQQELIAEISAIGARMGDPTLSAEQRHDLAMEIREMQKELRSIVATERSRHPDQVRAVSPLSPEQHAEIARQVRIAAAAAERERKRFDPPRGPNRAARSPRRGPAEGPAPPDAPAVAPEVPVAMDAEPVRVAEEPANTPVVEKKTIVRKEVSPADTRKGTQAAAARPELGEKVKKSALILGRTFNAPVRKEGEVVGHLTAKIRPNEVIQRILGSSEEEGGEIPFAVDREGTLYTRNDLERTQLGELGVADRLARQQPLSGIEGWIVSTSTDPQSGLRIGVARPVGENLQELRRAAARNFGLGLGLIAFALIGIVPLSNHLTRDVKVVTEGAERIAHGDLMTRLPVKSENELGQLARAFNRMAEDLSIHQQRLLEQERARKEQEMQQRLLALEYERKSADLEEARRFQLSMLPRQVPELDSWEIAVYTRTATEVGGDYYDFHHADDVFSITIGDATGHGARAGTMVTVIKALFAGYGGAAPAEFLGDAAAKIRRMELGRMAMALSLASFRGRTMTIASAGMPPALVHRAAGGTIDEIALSATPLGTLGTEYPEATVELEPGDTVLFHSDGLPELLNEAGVQLGYPAAAEAFSRAASAETADGVIAALARTVRDWRGDAPPNDDVTFVVVRCA